MRVIYLFIMKIILKVQ